jgi:hypothetical protein
MREQLASWLEQREHTPRPQRRQRCRRLKNENSTLQICAPAQCAVTASHGESALHLAL